MLLSPDRHQISRTPVAGPPGPRRPARHRLTTASDLHTSRTCSGIILHCLGQKPALIRYPSSLLSVCSQMRFFSKIEEDDKNNQKAKADIPRIIFLSPTLVRLWRIYPPLAERDWEKRPFMDRHYLTSSPYNKIPTNAIKLKVDDTNNQKAYA
jgi:hypothetical protein